MLTGISASAADGDTFTATTIEGVEMTFKILSEEEKTVQVGKGDFLNSAISTSTMGSVTIPNVVSVGDTDYMVQSIGRSSFYNITVR